MRFLAIMCLAAIGVADIAHATTTTLTIQGDVLSGTDVIGSFGTRNADLSGQPFKAVYTIDYDKPGQFYANAFQYYVGTDDPSAYQVVTSALTIGGVTLDNDGAFGDYASLTDGATSPFGNAEVVAYTQSLNPNVVDQLDFDLYSKQNFINSADFSRPFLYKPNTETFGGGSLYMYGFDPSNTSTSFSTYLNLVPTSVELGDVSALPEPSVWALMIAGFATVGGVMRRRRVSRTSAFG